MKPDLGIKEQNLTEINDLLNHVLADGNVLYIKLRKFHWNLSGDNFMELHKLFEEQYDAVAEAIDEVAERIRRGYCSAHGGAAVSDKAGETIFHILARAAAGLSRRDEPRCQNSG